MTTQVLLEAGLDPSAVIGGKLPAITPTAATATAKTLSVKVANITIPFCI